MPRKRKDVTKDESPVNDEPTRDPTERTPEDEQRVRKQTADFLRNHFKAWWDDSFQEGSDMPTLREFSEYLGVYTPSLSRWMTGKGIPNERQQARIAEKLGFGIYDATETSIPLPSDPEARDLFLEYMSLSYEERQAVLSKMRAWVRENRGRVPNGVTHGLTS